MGYHFDCLVKPDSKLFFLFSGRHFLDLLRCSKVRWRNVAIVTLRSDQQGDKVVVNLILRGRDVPCKIKVTHVDPIYMLITPCNIGNNLFEQIDPILRWNLVCRIGSKHVNPILHTPCRSNFR